jgi:hypothetical protein
VLIPGELWEGFEGICGEEKLLLPRLPVERPPPALAQALDSINVAIPKKNRVEKRRAKCIFLLICRFLFITGFRTQGARQQIIVKALPHGGIPSFPQASGGNDDLNVRRVNYLGSSRISVKVNEWGPPLPRFGGEGGGVGAIRSDLPSP